MRKSEGESKPDAHSNALPIALPSPQLIHTAHPTPNPLSNPLTDSLSDNLPTPPSIEFHTATDICFEIYLQIIYQTDDIVITHSCFTTCASRSNQEVVKKWSRSECGVKPEWVW